MDDGMKKIWTTVIVSAVLVGVLLRLMMAEFDYNGLTFFAVVFGFGAVGVFQIGVVIITEKMREQPQPIRYW